METTVLARRPYDAMKALVVKITAQQFNVTESYVRICLKGERRYGRSQPIQEYFALKYQEMQRILG